MNFQNKRLIAILAAAAFLLLIPLAAMAVTDEMKWGVFDFLVAGVLLFGTGIACEIAFRLIKKFEHRLVACAGILAVLVLVWIELAVGLFGSPLAGS